MFANPEVLIKALVKAVTLLKFRSERKRSFFEQIVAPTYKDVEQVVSDYHQVWSDVLPILMETAGTASIDRKALLSMQSRLKSLRDKGSIQRHKLAGVAIELQHSDDIAIQEFGRTIEQLFGFQDRTGNLESDLGRLCAKFSDDRKLQLVEWDGVDLWPEVDHVIEFQHRVRRSWVKLSKLFMDIKMRCYRTV